MNMKANQFASTVAAFALASFLTLLVAFASPANAQQPNHGQQGVTMMTCHADNVYIYKYPEGRPDQRLGRMGRGWAFRVYHFANDRWAFGVHNGSGVSGYVLREKLCGR
jgi:hypothetical protein